MILDPFSRLSRFRSLAPMYYRGAQAALVVYDITNLVRPPGACWCRHVDASA